MCCNGNILEQLHKCSVPKKAHANTEHLGVPVLDLLFYSMLFSAISGTGFYL